MYRRSIVIKINPELTTSSVTDEGEALRAERDALQDQAEALARELRDARDEREDLEAELDGVKQDQDKLREDADFVQKVGWLPTFSSFPSHDSCELLKSLILLFVSCLLTRRRRQKRLRMSSTRHVTS